MRRSASGLKGRVPKASGAPSSGSARGDRSVRRPAMRSTPEAVEVATRTIEVALVTPRGERHQMHTRRVLDPEGSDRGAFAFGATRARGTCVTAPCVAAPRMRVEVEAGTTHTVTAAHRPRRSWRRVGLHVALVNALTERVDVSARLPSATIVPHEIAPKHAEMLRLGEGNGARPETRRLNRGNTRANGSIERHPLAIVPTSRDHRARAAR